MLRGTKLLNCSPCLTKQLSKLSTCYFQSQNTKDLTNMKLASSSPRTCLSAVSTFPLYVPMRCYMRKKTVYRPPTKPFAFNYVADYNITMDPVDPARPRPGYEDVEILDEEESVRRMYSMEFGVGKEIHDIRLKDIIEKTQHHPLDVKSLEVKIAILTINIRTQMNHCDKFRKDKVAKRHLWSRLLCRKKKLEELRTLDYDRFEWLCKELNVQYEPPVFKSPYQKPMGRRALAKKAARDDMFTEKKAKMNALQERFEKEKEAFLEAKEKELEELKKELKKMGVEDMSSVEVIYKQLGLGEPYIPKREPKMSRRDTILARKFKLHEEKMKQQQGSS